MLVGGYSEYDFIYLLVLCFREISYIYEGKGRNIGKFIGVEDRDVGLIVGLFVVV